MPGQNGVQAEAMPWSRLIGENPRIREMKAFLERLAREQEDSIILLSGESGVGKEVAAEEIHRMSVRAAGPFVVVDLSAISRELLENELFGHERGAFTGATCSAAGLLEAAHGGTLFLDQIEDMPFHLQSRLLRFVERREVRRIGGTSYRQVNTRLIVATRRDLAQAVKAGEFRDDLYHRLNEFPVSILPLRERVDDIPLLTRHFLELPAEGFIPEATLTLLGQHLWPGNVRELRNVIERARFFSRGSRLKPSAVEAALNGAAQPKPTPPEPATAPPLVPSVEPAVVQTVEPVIPGFKREELYAERNALERRWLLNLLRQTGGNVVHASKLAGFRETSSLRHLIQKLGVADEVAAMRGRSQRTTDRPTP